MPVNDGEVLLINKPRLPKSAQFASGIVLFGNDGDSTRLPLQSVDQVRTRGLAQVQSDATDQARVFIRLGWMTHETRRFVDHQQVGIFMDDLEQLFQFGLLDEWIIGWLLANNPEIPQSPNPTIQ